MLEEQKCFLVGLSNSTFLVRKRSCDSGKAMDDLNNIILFGTVNLHEIVFFFLKWTTGGNFISLSGIIKNVD